LIEVSLIEAILDMQFEVLTTYLNDGGKPPQRSSTNSGHAYLPAPYGVYATKDGYIAVAMNPVDRLGELLPCPPLLAYANKGQWFSHRDEIKRILADRLRSETTAHWMAIFTAADAWASEVLDWTALMRSDAFRQLDFIQELDIGPTQTLKATRCPIRLDGRLLKSSVPAPAVGQHTDAIEAEFSLEPQ
ncbi:MAG TPA: CoA transferase, partial [Woeseiaceae bacterium]|nr:CoA transferase [Woeseiaceae bacterium]